MNAALKQKIRTGIIAAAAARFNKLQAEDAATLPKSPGERAEAIQYLARKNRDYVLAEIRARRDSILAGGSSESFAAQADFQAAKVLSNAAAADMSDSVFRGTCVAVLGMLEDAVLVSDDGIIEKIAAVVDNAAK